MYPYYILFILHYTALCQNINKEYNHIEFNKAVLKFCEGPVLDIDTHELYLNFNNYIILDCREYKEYQTSHLKNSIWVGFNNFNFDKIPKKSIQKKIIVYCTIGWRSEKIGEKLLKHGYKNVYNLRGSILKWNNDNYPIYKGNNQQTTLIHTYNKSFNKFVRKGKIIDF